MLSKENNKKNEEIKSKEIENTLTSQDINSNEYLQNSDTLFNKLFEIVGEPGEYSYCAKVRTALPILKDKDDKEFINISLYDIRVAKVDYDFIKEKEYKHTLAITISCKRCGTSYSERFNKKSSFKSFIDFINSIKNKDSHISDNICVNCHKNYKMRIEKERAIRKEVLEKANHLKNILEEGDIIEYVEMFGDIYRIPSRHRIIEKGKLIKIKERGTDFKLLYKFSRGGYEIEEYESPYIFEVLNTKTLKVVEIEGLKQVKTSISLFSKSEYEIISSLLQNESLVSDDLSISVRNKEILSKLRRLSKL